MRIEISGHNLSLTPSLGEYAKEKFGLLGKLLEQFDYEGGVALRAVLERTTSHHHKGEIYRVTANLTLPHGTLRAEKSHENIRAAVDIVQEELEGQIRKYRTTHLA